MPGGRTGTLTRQRPGLVYPCARADAPPVAPPPAVAGNPVTFGSFHNLSKLNDKLLSLYARTLAATPGSRLLFKYRGLENPRLRESFGLRLAAFGIPSDRAVLEPPAPDTRATLDAHRRIDIMLDSFPFNGATTTCNALFMGVPVIALSGDRSASRVGASILAAIGRRELIAESPDGFVHAAAALAGDAPRLAGLRSRLRADLLASPLGDAPAFARRFESALRALWRSGQATAP